MKNTAYYSFREVTRMTELEPLLRLRYKVFKEESTTDDLFPENDLELDLDFYDLRSRHFGVYHIENDRETPVGYQRLILEEETRIAPSLRRWAADKPVLMERLAPQTKKAPLYLMTLNSSDAMWKYFFEKKDWGASFAEASRICVLNEHRSFGVTKFIFYSDMAVVFWILKSDIGITSCTTKQAILHRRLGLKVIPGCNYDKNGVECSVLDVRQSDFSPHQYEELEKMAEAYHVQDCICHHPEEPDNYWLPGYGVKEVEEQGLLVAA